MSSSKCEYGIADRVVLWLESLVMLILPIVTVVACYTYRDACTADPQLPQYLGARAVFLIVKMMFLVYGSNISNLQLANIVYVLGVGVDITLALLFFMGLYSIYEIFIPEFADITSSQYCHMNIYYLAIIDTVFYLTYLLVLYKSNILSNNSKKVAD